MADGEIKDTLGVKTKWFDLTASGPVVILIILGLAINGSIAWLIKDQTQLLSQEHHEVRDWMQKMDCQINLDIYINSIPEGQVISWYKMPKELRPCMPSYLLEKENGRQEIIKQKPRAREE